MPRGDRVSGRWAYTVSISSPALGGCQAMLARPDILLPPKAEDTLTASALCRGPEVLLTSSTWRKIHPRKSGFLYSSSNLEIAPLSPATRLSLLKQR